MGIVADMSGSFLLVESLKSRAHTYADTYAHTYENWVFNSSDDDVMGVGHSFGAVLRVTDVS